MQNFEPFDEEYKFDPEILTEDFPKYMIDSIVAWSEALLNNRRMIVMRDKLSPTFLLPYDRVFRTNLDPHWAIVTTKLRSNLKFARNFISYLLQIYASEKEGEALERILAESSSAYTVEKSSEKVLLVQSGALSTSITKMKLVYRVAAIVKKQSEMIISSNELLSEAWESHYGIPSDDEKTITRCADALAGLLRDQFFPTEKRTQLGTLISKIIQDPEDYSFPASTIYNKEELLNLMSNFSKIRGNHKSGTGRTPTHEEALFVLHFSIMFFQLFYNYRIKDTG